MKKGKKGRTFWLAQDKVAHESVLISKKPPEYWCFNSPFAPRPCQFLDADVVKAVTGTLPGPGKAIQVELVVKSTEGPEADYELGGAEP